MCFAPDTEQPQRVGDHECFSKQFLLVISLFWFAVVPCSLGPIICVTTQLQALLFCVRYA